MNAIVISGDAEPSDIIQQVVSNMARREGLIDRACGYARLKEAGKTSKQIAELMGRDRTHVE